MLKRRQQDIRDKGFNLMGEEDMAPRDYAKMRAGIRTVNNALVNLGTYRKSTQTTAIRALFSMLFTDMIIRH